MRVKVLKMATLHPTALQYMKDERHMDYFAASEQDTILDRFAQDIDSIFTSGGNFHIMAEYNFDTAAWKATFLSPRQPGTHQNKLDLAKNWLTTYGGAPGVPGYL